MPASFPQGNFIKFIKNSLKLGLDEPTFIMAGDTDDPTSVAKDAPIGSLYFREGTDEVYKKLDAGSSTNWEPLGDLVGPASSTDDAVVRFDGTTGKVIQNSTVTLSDAGVMAGASIDADTNTITNIENADIKAAAAIDATKIADGSVTSAEFQFINTLSSNAQTQLDARVVGPASATDNAVVRYDATTGKLVQDSSVIISDTDAVSGITQLDVDNVQINGNTISSTDTNGNINLTPDGTGEVLLKADGVGSLAAVTKQQLDTALDGVQRKASVATATTANITLSGEQTIDGVLTSTSRVLVKDQSTASENGIYVSAAGAWSRSSDANSSAELDHAITSVQAGTANGNTAWEQTTDSPSIGVDNIVWIQAYGAGTFVADETTLTLTGSTFSILSGGVSNTQVNASAAIALTKLAATTNNRATATDASGFIVASAVTDTELGHLSGVTSAIQTQLNARVVGPATATDNALARYDATTGELIQDSLAILDDVGALSGLTQLDVDNIQVNGNSIISTDTNGNITISPDGTGTVDVDTSRITSVTNPTGAQDAATKNYVDTAKFSVNSISTNTNAVAFETYLVDTTAAVQVTLPTPTADTFVRIKDATGNANTQNITVARNGAEDIDGTAASFTMNSNWEAKVFVSDGTDWFVF